MAEKRLDVPDVGTALEKVRRHRVAPDAVARIIKTAP